MSGILILLCGGLAAGTLGGLLGLGGGIILLPLLRFGFGLSPAHAAGTCILAVFFTTLGGSYRHFRLKHVSIGPIFPVIVAGAFASIVASIAFQQLAWRGRWLDLGIGLVFLLISIRMLFETISGLADSKRYEKSGVRVEGTMTAKLGIGATAGVFPGLLGIGTGSILVPAFVFILKAPAKAAIGASLVCFCLNSLISASFKLAQGFVELRLAIPICLGTLIGANLGGLMNGHFSSTTVKMMFGIVFGYVSLKFLASFWEITI
jgi:uncharacterized membrane protein YfcA